MVQIYYLIDFKAKEFFFYEDHTAAKQKEKELMDKYGPLKNKIFPDTDFPPCPVEWKTLKNYYGTVWLAIKWSDSGAAHYHIQGRWKDIKHNKENDYEIKKFVLTPYDEYMKEDEELEREGDVQVWRDLMDNADLSKLEDDDDPEPIKIKKVSPGFS